MESPATPNRSCCICALKAASPEGGSIDGVIHFCTETLNRIDEHTLVIPGHVPVSDYQELSDYTDILTIVRDRIVTLIKLGKSLEEIMAAEPTAEYDEKMGDPTMLINQTYVGLTHRFVN